MTVFSDNFYKLRAYTISKITLKRNNECKKMNYLVVLVFLNIFQTYINYNIGKQRYTKVTHYKKCVEGYHYSNDYYYFRTDRYMAVLSAEYMEDTLEYASIFKCESELVYKSIELKADTLLVQTLNLPFKRNIKIEGNQIFDNDHVYTIAEFKKDSIFCLKGDSLVLYVIND